MSEQVTPNMPAVHLWNSIVGTELFATIGEGPVEVHLPVSLAAGVANECGVADAAMFLTLIVRAALPHIAPTVKCPDLIDEIASVIEQLGWHGGERREVTMEADLDQAASTVKVRSSEPLEPLETPGFPSVKSTAYSSKSEGLWSPYRFIDELPMVVTARAGGRPGWGAKRGLDITGAIKSYSTGDMWSSFDGWPLVVLRSDSQLVRLEAQWDLRERGKGLLVAVRLVRLDDNSRAANAPEWLIENMASLHEEPLEMFNKPRVMVTADENLLLHVGVGVWAVSGPRKEERFEHLLEAIDALDEFVTSTTRIDYHDSLEELQDAADSDGRGHLFPDSPDGMWNLGNDTGFWVPARAEYEYEDVFDEIGVYGKHGYFVRLYRWNKQYFYSYDDGWEAPNVGWEILGKITRKDAIAQARADATALWAATGLTDEDLADYEEGF